MHPEDITWLRTPEGQAATEAARAALAQGERELTVLERLRRDHTRQRAGAVLALVEGRRAATAKFADAGRLLLDREAAEQATSDLVATHTARRFEGRGLIVDLCAGAGGDALALAQHAHVIAVDRNPARLAMLAANAQMRGLAERIEPVEADVLTFSPPSDAAAVWIDPARRDERGRSYDPERWSPTLAQALAIARRYPGGGIKVAPGLDVIHVPEDAEVEFISLRGDLVEAVVWLGDLRTARRRATALPQGASLADTDGSSAQADVRSVGAYLYDLDSGVGRAGLVDLLAVRLGAWKLDERVVYLSSGEPLESPFVRRFRVFASMAFSERRLLAALREAGATRVEVMRRAAPVDTNALERRLNRALPGGGTPTTVAITRIGGELTAIVCERQRAEA